MALAESQCYTIINSPELTDVYNEMKIKKDLGEWPYFDDALHRVLELKHNVLIGCFSQNKETRTCKSKH